MLITKADLIMAPLIDGFCRLPNDIAIAPNVHIRHPGVIVGSKTVIDSGVMIFSGVHIGFGVLIAPRAVIGEGVHIHDKVMIGLDVEIGRETIIGSRSYIDCESRIGRNAYIAPGAYIASGANIDNNITVNVFTSKYRANYTGEVDGKHLFRLGCEIRPLSWFTSRKKRTCSSGWGRVRRLKEISGKEYRRYLRFFKSEAKRLGI